MAVTWDKTASTLYDYKEKLIRNYQITLIAENVHASGRLGRISGAVNMNGRFLQIDINIEDYWRIVENGRRPGKFPPPDAIIEWIRVKPIMPRETGKIPSEKSLAYLIGRKIARDGIPGKHPFSSANDKTYEEFKNKISEAITIDIGAETLRIVNILT